ncbi:MAG: DEAD/DEAH box helicase family protein [Ignavibacterium album]|nr:DEAD/DEAH box helicase family protein [Ignavibacterium album]
MNFQLGDETIPNLPPYYNFEDEFLLSNLIEVQKENSKFCKGLDQNLNLEKDSGLLLEGIGHTAWSYPSYTIEMETGTGKTYVYLRTIFELRKHYGFGKFIIIVPSIAIYEGTIKNFQITKDHFRTLYGNETVNLIEYEGQQISKLRHFASSSSLEILLMTIDSFNKATNVIYKATEKLPGEKLPYQYIQETKPILILDESQNYTSERAKSALRTIHPLFALRYSATPKEKPNLIYRLSPIDAFKLNLVKKIEVYGVTELDNVNQLSLALEKIFGYGPQASVKLPVISNGEKKEASVIFKKGDDVYDKTGNEDFKDIKVDEINKQFGFIAFSDNTRLSVHDISDPTNSKINIFRIQIEETIKRHLKKQAELRATGIKVLSLFFIDRVANYTSDDAIIPKLFDNAFNKFKNDYDEFKELNGQDVRQAYFAQKKNKQGTIDFIDTREDESKKTKEEKEVEKIAYELIMKNKEQLLSFDEKVSFIFAHSALKEGWDNPNVFQICTLRDTQSEMRKRQEIGRGLRLAVNQNGERSTDDHVNILTVIANESYESFVNQLQNEYIETGDVAPPKPSNASKDYAKRNNKIFKSEAFKEFWEKLNRKTDYKIKIDSDKLIDECIARLNVETYPEPQIVVTKGKFVITHFTFKLISTQQDKARMQIDVEDTEGKKDTYIRTFSLRDDISKMVKNDDLKGFKILKIHTGSSPEVEFDNGQILSTKNLLEFDSKEGQAITEKFYEESKTTYPIFNVIERIKKETDLTRPTIIKIFKGIKDEKKKYIFRNPEGFTSVLINSIKNTLSQHIADRIEYSVDGDKINFEVEEIFPALKKYPQKEILEGNKVSLYDQIQIDSEVEKRFVESYLKDDEKVLFFFKFPSKFKINIPKIIGNYNPDWGIVRMNDDGKIKLELVRETKGYKDLNLLQYPNEKRKIECAKKHFNELKIDYRHVDDKTPRWWVSEQEARQFEIEDG